jgi:hypothetical protein
MGSTISKKDGWREAKVTNLRSKILLGDMRLAEARVNIYGG